jgi:ParB-like chromosome segregation protein Spo0J
LPVATLHLRQQLLHRSIMIYGADMLQIEMVDPDRLIPYLRKARTHTPEQVNQIAASMQEFGFTNPILIGEDDLVIAGHGRLMAAQSLGLA